EQYERYVILGHLRYVGAWPPFAAPVSVPPLTVDPRTVLHSVYEWWMRRRGELVTEYERRRYPDGSGPTGLPRSWEERPDVRRKWLSVFVLGALHTVGRTSEHQDRGFLQLLHQNGWLREFAEATDPGRLERWMLVLKSYLDRQRQQMPYALWMM